MTAKDGLGQNGTCVLKASRGSRLNQSTPSCESFQRVFGVNLHRAARRLLFPPGQRLPDRRMFLQRLPPAFRLVGTELM